ncbi:hypothetical protein ACF9IK_36885 [Kitasatospora hibisci]|uniref:hypothetical protein n=1 Tax=Kitasatospora hibisci TaxID=3369522 RepID=UPI0037543D39
MMTYKARCGRSETEEGKPVASRWKIVISVAVTLLVIGVALVGWQVMKRTAALDLEGAWKNGSVLLELKPDGSVGASKLPVSVCDGTVGALGDVVTEIKGTWKEEYFTDAGDGVRIDATRSDGGGRCNFWMAYSSHDGSAELWFSYVPSPVRSLVKVP